MDDGQSRGGTASSSRIERFLIDHPRGDLMVAVGFASPAGLAWLGQRTRGRRISLLIGDTRYKYWRNVSRADRNDCLAFLRRADVEVRNWYRTNKSRHGESAAHLKVWAVHDRGSVSAALVGSGNLTRRGLDDNVEVMVEAHGLDRQETWATIHTRTWCARV